MSKLSRKKHADHVIQILQPDASPYRKGSNREKAWHVVSLMNGLTVEEAHQILKKLETNIQGKVARPIGWLSDAIELGVAKLKKPSQ